MPTRTRLLTLTAAVGLAATVHAGTPLSSPFSVLDGGFLPPDATTAKSELQVYKAVTTFMARSVACYAHAEKNLVAGAEIELANCLAGADDRWNTIMQRLSTTLPLCIDPTALRVAVEQTIATDITPRVYCDGALDPGTGLHVASSDTVLRGEVGVSNVSLFANKSEDVCGYKAIRSAIATGTYYPALAACEASFGEKWFRKRSKLYASGLPPACVDIDAAADIANVPVGAFYRTRHIFCASPSGAFLD
jgi:hypothetical protein